MMDYSNQRRRIVPNDNLIYPQNKIIVLPNVDDAILIVVHIMYDSSLCTYAFVEEGELTLVCNDTSGIHISRIGSTFLIPEGELHISKRLYDEIIDRIASLGGVDDG